jgi:hypothetical protein
VDWKLATVWYATRKRIESTTKLIVFDERGKLEQSGDKLRFTSKKRTIDMSDLSAIELTGHRTNWVIYTIINVLLIPYFWLVGTPVIAAIVIVVFANAIGLLVSLKTKWVHVAFRDAAGQPGEAYFADGSTMGWGGILGGTQRLFEKLRGTPSG